MTGPTPKGLPAKPDFSANAINKKMQEIRIAHLPKVPTNDAVDKHANQEKQQQTLKESKKELLSAKDKLINIKKEAEQERKQLPDHKESNRAQDTKRLTLRDIEHDCDNTINAINKQIKSIDNQLNQVNNNARPLTTTKSIPPTKNQLNNQQVAQPTQFVDGTKTYLSHWSKDPQMQSKIFSLATRWAKNSLSDADKSYLTKLPILDKDNGVMRGDAIRDLRNLILKTPSSEVRKMHNNLKDAAEGRPTVAPSKP